MRIAILLSLLTISIFHQCAIAQERPNFSCLTPEQRELLTKELRELQESHHARSLEIGRDLADATRKNMAASEAYRKCTSSASFVGSLLGDDCTREKNVMDMMNGLVETQSMLSKTHNSTTQTRLMLTVNKYPKCN